MSSSLFVKIYFGVILFFVAVMGIRIIEAENVIGASRAGYSYLVAADNIGLVILIIFATIALIYKRTQKTSTNIQH
tara:strand:+ start:14420 stop:14647 length:228 start_codon:yes stop_codon:yes gene_type:complete